MFEPSNEMGVVVLFAQEVASDNNVSISSVRTAYPDATVLFGAIEYRVEFEYLASNFLLHKHDPRGCDLIVCWIDDLGSESKLPIIELSKCNDGLPHPLASDEALKEIWYWETRAKRAEKSLKALRSRLDNYEPHGGACDDNAGDKQQRISIRREQVLQHVLDGKNTSEVAALLDVSTDTIRRDIKQLAGEPES